MDIATAILACSLYADDMMVGAIADSGSHGNTYFVHVATAGGIGTVDDQPRSLAEAMARAGDTKATAGRMALGLMSIPTEWLDSFGRPLRDAFDPCVNIAIGTAMLSQFAFEYRRQPHSQSLPTEIRQDDLRACTTRRYAEAIGMPELEELVALNLIYRQSLPVADAADAPLFIMPAGDQWGPIRILVPLRKTP